MADAPDSKSGARKSVRSAVVARAAHSLNQSARPRYFHDRVPDLRCRATSCRDKVAEHHTVPTQSQQNLDALVAKRIWIIVCVIRDASPMHAASTEGPLAKRRKRSFSFDLRRLSRRMFDLRLGAGASASTLGFG